MGAAFREGEGHAACVSGKNSQVAGTASTKALKQVRAWPVYEMPRKPG